MASNEPNEAPNLFITKSLISHLKDRIEAVEDKYKVYVNNLDN